MILHPNKRTKFLIKMILVLLIILTFFKILSFLRPVYNSADVKKISYLMNLNYSNSIPDTNLPHNELRDFNFEKYTFPFKNFSSLNSDGVCIGISLFEKLNYTNTLKDYNFKINGKIIKLNNKLDLSNYYLNSKDILNIYGYSYGLPYAKFREDIKINNRDASTLLDMSTKKKTLDNFKNKNLSKELTEILCTINYLKVNSDLIPSKTISPYSYKSRTDIPGEILVELHSKIIYKNTKPVYRSLEIKNITTVIDHNIPVVISILNDLSGHSLFGYKYEYIDKNTMKLYVSDSNFPIVKDEEISYKDEIKRNCYVLFKRDSEKSRWNFIYNPCIEGNYVYKGVYNSFIPGTYLYIQ